jgi:hypothetical protein
MTSSGFDDLTGGSRIGLTGLLTIVSSGWISLLGFLGELTFGQ